MELTARLILTLTGFTSATISAGRSLSACCPKPAKPVKVPTTSNSDQPRKRCSMMRESGGELTIRIVVLHK